jgi:DNA-binding transcriptional LysR family regulator
LTSPWHGVELRHLTALSAVGEERSFRGAADRLGYVQSAVSQQISQFEDLVGARLIERERGHAAVALTEAGEVMLEHAEEVLSQLSAARADLASLTNGDETTLRVGALESVARRVLPRTLALLYEREPELRIEVLEQPTDADFFPALGRGELDVAFTELPAADGPFASVEVFRDPCVLVVAARPANGNGNRNGGANGNGASPVSLADAADLPLIGRPGWRFRGLIDSEFGARGLRLRYTASAETSSAAQALVAGGRAAAIMPRLAVATDDPETEILALDPALPARTLALHWHRERRHGDALAVFREAVLDACAERFPSEMATASGRRRAEERARMPGRTRLSATLMSAAE